MIGLVLLLVGIAAYVLILWWVAPRIDRVHKRIAEEGDRGKFP